MRRSRSAAATPWNPQGSKTWAEQEAAQKVYLLWKRAKPENSALLGSGGVARDGCRPLWSSFNLRESGECDMVVDGVHRTVVPAAGHPSYSLVETSSQNPSLAGRSGDGFTAMAAKASCSPGPAYAPLASKTAQWQRFAKAPLVSFVDGCDPAGGPGAFDPCESGVDKFHGPVDSTFGTEPRKGMNESRRYLSKEQLSSRLCTESPGPMYSPFVAPSGVSVSRFPKGPAGCLHITQAVQQSCTPGPAMVTVASGGPTQPRFGGAPRFEAAAAASTGASYDVRTQVDSLPLFPVKPRPFRRSKDRDKKRVAGWVHSLLGPDIRMHGDTLHASGVPPPLLRQPDITDRRRSGIGLAAAGEEFHLGGGGLGQTAVFDPSRRRYSTYLA